MFDSPDTQRRIGRFAWAMAWFGLVAGQLHALARFATEEGRSDLDVAAVRFWAESAADLLSPLLDWASPDVVYLTYGKLWLPVFLAFTLCAFVVRRRRQDHDAVRGAEKWAWRLALTGYTLACVCVAAEYWTMWTAIDDALLDGVFLASLPVLLLTMLASTFLGIVLIRRGLGLPGWLLALALPGVFAISAITSLGNVVLPIAFAFGILGRRLSADADETSRSMQGSRRARVH
jgi:hypothetical protein